MRVSLFVLLAVAASGAIAQEAPPPARESIDDLVAALDAEQFERRESAMGELMLREDLDDANLARHMRAAPTPERRERLIRVAMHRFYARLNPPGFNAGVGIGCIGIDIARRNMIRPDQAPQLKHPALLVTRTRVGFPAYAVLRPGDMILAFEGKRFGADLADEQALVEVIQRFRPGQDVRLIVMRDDKEIAVSMRLDDLDRLRAVQNLIALDEQPEHFGPWRDHLRNMLGGDPDPRPILLAPEAGAAEPADGVDGEKRS